MSTERQTHYDAADSAGLSFGEREPRVRRSRPSTDRLGRSREELDMREEQEVRPSDPGEADRRPAPRPVLGQDRDAWRENRRHHQSSQILLAFGSSSPRWESSADMGRRYVEFWSRPGSPVTPRSHLPPRCTSSSQLDSAGQRATLDEEPSARRHRSDLTPTAPPGHSFRDPPPARHRSPGVSASASGGSRPSSSLSQQGTGAPGTRPSPLRMRSGPRRPRPSSIAGMPSARPSTDAGVQQNEVRVPSRSGSSSTPRRPLPASAPSSEPRRPAAASPRRTPAQVKADDARKKKQRSKSSTPQPESRPAASQQQPESQPAISRQPGSGSSAGSEPSISPAPSGNSAEGSTEQPRGGSTEPPQPERTAPSEQADVGTASRKAGYDSEAAAKAALAEKRRQAREEAERQAELERLRREEQERQEQERQRQEELLMEEAARAEQERLQKAIQEAEERRAEEERRRQQEQEQRRLKEQEEEAAREEAERARAAAAEKLQREEQERRERRSRVAAIMSRTRNKNTAEKAADSSEEEQAASLTAPSTDSRQETGSLTPPGAETRPREEGSSLESQASEVNPDGQEEADDAATVPEEAPASSSAEIDVTPASLELNPAPPSPDQQAEQPSEQAQMPSPELTQTPSPEPARERSLESDQEHGQQFGQESVQRQDQEQEQEQEQPMSTDSSPAHTNTDRIANGTNGLEDSGDPEPDTNPTTEHQNGGLSPLQSLVTKPTAVSEDEDSLNSNVSPRPGTAPQQDPLARGLTGAGPATPGLAQTVHTTELVQL